MVKIPTDVLNEALKEFAKPVSQTLDETDANGSYALDTVEVPVSINEDESLSIPSIAALRAGTNS